MKNRWVWWSNWDGVEMFLNGRKSIRINLAAPSGDYEHLSPIQLVKKRVVNSKQGN